jgi:hypothetical protein
LEKPYWAFQALVFMSAAVVSIVCPDVTGHAGWGCFGFLESPRGTDFAPPKSATFKKPWLAWNTDLFAGTLFVHFFGKVSFQTTGATETSGAGV